MPRIGGFLVRCGASAALFLVSLAGNGAPARADCYELIGCTDSDQYKVSDLVTLSCENLWFVRNRIFDENGYCFKTERAQEMFDNSDCLVDDQEQVKLSAIERQNVEAIVMAEREIGCR